jgi:hypothetical protein
MLRYVASLHGAGREPGIMAVTTFAEIEPQPAQDGEDSSPVREHITTTVDAFRFVHTESTDEINQRAGDLETLLDDGLAVALANMMTKL